MKLRLIREGIVVTGHPGLKLGDVFEETRQPGYIISLGIAEEVKDSPRNLDEPTSREPEIESRDPEIKPVKRTKKTLP